MEGFLQKAKLAEQAERYDDMREAMKQVVVLTGGGAAYSGECRNLLSVAYKNVVGACRSSWRVVSSIEQREAQETEGRMKQMASGYREKIEEELREICNEVIDLLEKHLIKEQVDKEDEMEVEAKVFHLKMKGDYHRYKAEFSRGNDRQEAVEASEKAYKEGYELAGSLKSTNPVRLGLALNYSVFYYEIQNSSEKACGLAKQAFDEAIDQLGDGVYKDSSLILQLLRDNLTLWTAEDEQGEQGEDED